MESTTCSNTIGTADGVSAWSMSDDQLTTALLDNATQLNQLQGRQLELIREADARNLAVTAGAANTAQWVAGVLRVPSAEAGAMVKLASHLHADLPATARALAEGEISVPHARVISRVVTMLPSHIATPELRSEVEATLLKNAATFDPKVLGKVGNRLLETVAPDLADQVLELKLKQEEASAERDRFLRMTFDTTSGTWRVTARLPKVVGERLKLVLDPLAAPQPGPDGRDTRLPEQRNVDALDEACRRLLAEKLVPSHGGNPTQLVVTVTQTGGRTLHTGIELSRKLVDQLMCEADRAFLVKPDDQPGRVTLLTDTQQRLFQGKLRRLLELRDGGCAFPGCDRPPGWCHAHHVVPWSKGGPTTRDNGVLLCGYHHRLIHQGAWQVRIALDGLPEFLPPDWIDPHQQPLRNHRLTLACLPLSGLRTAYGPVWKGELVVARRKGTFTPEFREEAARLVVESGRRIADVAREIGVGETTLGNWVKAYRETHVGEESPLELSERARLRELERKVRELEMENNFLKRAAAYFAKEQR